MMRRHKQPAIPGGIFALLLGCVLTSAGSPLQAGPFDLSYSARLVDSVGKPKTEAVNLAVKFYDSANGGSQRGGSLLFNEVRPNAAGIFTISLTIPNTDLNAIIDVSKETWIEITELGSGQVYPRQRMTAAPLALKTLIDNQTLRYDESGRLSVNSIGQSKVLGLSESLNKLASTVHTHSLGGDVSGDLAANTVIKLRGQNISSLIPTVGQYLKWNGTAWEPATFGGDINLGSKATLGLGAYTIAEETTLNLGADNEGKMWYNSETNQLRYWDGEHIKDVSSLGAGLNNLNGQTGNIQNLAFGTSGIAPGWHSEADTHTLNIPQASATGVTSGLISKADYDAFAAKVDKTGGAVTGALSMTAQNQLRFSELTPNGLESVGLRAPSSITTDVTWTLPANDGGLGQVLKTDGVGNLGWATVGTGSVTNITTGTGLSGGPITTTGTISLANSGVTAGSYTRADITVDAQGRLTAASSGSAITLSTSEVSGILSVANGGTGGNSYASNSVILGGTTFSSAAAGTADQVFRVPTAGGAPAFGAIDLSKSAAVTGTLAVANGGTGVTSTGANTIFAGPNASNGAPSFRALAANDLPLMVGASASAGTNGAVPAPAAGDGTAGKFLKADGTWAVPTGIVDWTSPGTIGSTTANTGRFSSLTTTGNVGIGTTSPATALDVQGQIRSLVYNAAAGTSFDWNNSNTQYTTATCGAFTFSNMKDGGIYTLIVKSTTQGTCAFTQAGLAFRSQTGLTTASGSYTIFNIIVAGADAFVTIRRGF